MSRNFAVILIDYFLYNVWKDQLYGISGSEFYELHFGLVKLSGLLRNARQVRGPGYSPSQSSFETQCIPNDGCEGDYGPGPRTPLTDYQEKLPKES